MDLVKVIEAFPTQEGCIAYLEHLRWAEIPECLYCVSTHVRRYNEGKTGRK